MANTNELYLKPDNNCSFKQIKLCVSKLTLKKLFKHTYENIQTSNKKSYILFSNKHWSKLDKKNWTFFNKLQKNYLYTQDSSFIQFNLFKIMN